MTNIVPLHTYHHQADLDALESAWRNACVAYLNALFNAAPGDVLRELGGEVLHSAHEYRRVQYGHGPAVRR